MSTFYLQTILDDAYADPRYIGNLEACKQQGYASGEQGVKRESNPYQQGTQEREWWYAGWSAAYDEITGT